jgi:uncharacterized protein (DUF305 family)
MKKVILVAAGVLMLASVTAYAQMNHRNAQGQSGHGMMHGQMHSQMHGEMPNQMHGKMHGKMQGKGSGNQQGGHGAHGADGPQGDRGPSSLAFHGINQQMHEGMNITFNGNADVDFVNGMIPHHQGAVDMAKVVLAFGKDPEIRKLAEAVIQAQESEIAMMRAWLQRNAK